MRTNHRTAKSDHCAAAGRGLPALRHWQQGGRSLFLRPDTGSWVVVEGTGAEIIELLQEGYNTADIVRTLVGRYRINQSRAEADVKAYIAQLHKSGFFDSASAGCVSSPFCLQALALHVTSRCPLDCRHCYASPAAVFGSDPSPELLMTAIEQARALGATTLKLTGGDPLSVPDLLGALVPVTNGIKVTVLTSAVGPGADLRRLVMDWGWRLQISLDGPDPLTHDWYRGSGAFARVTANLNALSEAGVGSSVTLAVCLSRINHKRIEEIIQQAIAWGVGGLLLVRVSRQGRAIHYWSQLDLAPEEWVETYAELTELYLRYMDRLRMTGFLGDYLLGCLRRPASRGCRLGETAMTDLDGRVYPCIMMGQEAHCLGDLGHEPLANCLAHERLQTLKVACGARLQPGGVCVDCDWRMICCGACPGWPMTQHGTLDATDGLCDLRRELLPKLIFHLAQQDSLRLAPGDRR